MHEQHYSGYYIIIVRLDCSKGMQKKNKNKKMFVKVLKDMTNNIQKEYNYNKE